jgi:hypothetical protein
MPEVGDIETAQLDVGNGDGTTTAVLTVTNPAGTVTTPTVTASLGGQRHTAPVTYATAGLWRLRWVVTGAGAGTTGLWVAVDPNLSAVTRRTYATTTDLANWIEAAPPEDAAKLLRRATREVDRLTRGARFDTDADDEPTDTVVLAALRDATCAVAEWWISTGDDLGAVGAYQSVSIGSVSLGRGSSGGGGAVDRVGPEAVSILAAAGLINNAPAVRW